MSQLCIPTQERGNEIFLSPLALQGGCSRSERGVNRNAKVGSFPPCFARGVSAKRTGGSFFARCRIMVVVLSGGCASLIHPTRLKPDVILRAVAESFRFSGKTLLSVI